MITNENKLRNDRDDHSAQQRNTGGREGQPMGGHNFGQEGKATPTGDDKDNPSRNAGYSNAYFARTEPLDEDTANNNFKAAHQQGEPDYDKAHVHNPGPQELPEQQNVGENNTSTPGKAKHSPDFDHKPDYGNQSKAGEKEHIET